jgi:hypothetical protein
VKVKKVKLPLCMTFILKLGTALVTLHPEKETLVASKTRLSGPQSQSGCFGEEINILILPGIEL